MIQQIFDQAITYIGFDNLRGQLLSALTLDEELTPIQKISIRFLAEKISPFLPLEDQILTIGWEDVGLDSGQVDALTQPQREAIVNMLKTISIQVIQDEIDRLEDLVQSA